MNIKQVFLLLCALAFMALAAGGCTASGELDEEREENTAPLRDTTEAEAPAPKPTTPAQTSRQGFTTKEDTIEVESAQRNHRTEHTPLTVQPRLPHADHPVYRVQIGAFREEANAARAKARLARRYATRQVAKLFDETSRLYRVSVGEFTTEKAARSFAAALRKKYSREYRDAWVVRTVE